MADQTQRAGRTFLRAWTAELEKSIEKLTGLTVRLRPQSGRDPAPDSQESLLWLGQSLERAGDGAVWIGASVETRAALTGVLAEDDAGRDSRYRQLLRQSLERAAQVLSAGRTPPLACKSDLKDGPAPANLGPVETVWLVTPDRKRWAILVRVEPGFGTLLRVKKSASTGGSGRPPAPGLSPDTACLHRLGDLELPVTVVLGRARLQIREVLKLTAGSLVELDRRVGELVELVVHNVVVARGEVVSVGGNYGIRIENVISRVDRLALQASANSLPARASQHTEVN